MKTTQKITALFVSFIVLTTLSVLAQDFDSAPIVPLEVLAKGRHAVISYLLKSPIDHVWLNYNGRSLVENRPRHVSALELSNLGYHHAGSFTEFNESLSQIEFSQAVIKTPQGSYDIGVETMVYNHVGRVILYGNGWLNIRESGKEGRLTAGEFQPFVRIPDTLLVKKNGYIRGAKWLSTDWRDRNLSYQYVGNDGMQGYTLISIPTELLGSGYLFFAEDNGDVKGVDLATAAVLAGKHVVALLGKSRSNDVVSVKDPASLGKALINISEDFHFYRSEGKIYGRFPLVDVSTVGWLKEAFFFGVKVWGTDEIIFPSSTTLKSVWVNEPAMFDPPAEQDIPFSPDAGGWIIVAPPGGYHLEIEFNNVLDWGADPNPKG